jgi:hypothetical protein
MKINVGIALQLAAFLAWAGYLSTVLIEGWIFPIGQLHE